MSNSTNGGVAAAGEWWTPRRQKRSIVLLLSLAVVAVYSQTLTFDFVKWDDTGKIRDNPFVRNGISVDGLRWAFLGARPPYWSPVTWLSHMLDAQIFGISAPGHHLTSVLLHILNTVLLFLLMDRSTGRALPSAVTAALFALHPLHVESVAWVSGRTDLVSTLFALLAMLCYVEYARRGGLGLYASSAGAFALGLMAKPSLMILPAIFLLLDYWPLKRCCGGESDPNDHDVILRRIPAPKSFVSLTIEKVPFLLLSCVAAALAYVSGSEAASISMPVEPPFHLRAANALASYVSYLQMTIWPRNLCALYPHPYLPGGVPLGAPRIVAASISLLALTGCALWRRRSRFILVGWCWYVLSLLPVIGLVRQFGPHALADRYTYFSLIGIFVVVSWGGADAISKWARSPYRRRIAWTVSLAALAAFSTLSWRQAATWRDSVSLFGRVVDLYPANALAHTYLGGSLLDLKRIDSALQHFERALELNPNELKARNGKEMALFLRSNRSVGDSASSPNE
jgi:hypothetical protein